MRGSVPPYPGACVQEVREAWEQYSRTELQRREREQNLLRYGYKQYYTKKVQKFKSRHYLLIHLVFREVDRVDRMAAKVALETERLRKLKVGGFLQFV